MRPPKVLLPGPEALCQPVPGHHPESSQPPLSRDLRILLKPEIWTSAPLSFWTSKGNAAKTLWHLCLLENTLKQSIWGRTRRGYGRQPWFHLFPSGTVSYLCLGFFKICFRCLGLMAGPFHLAIASLKGQQGHLWLHRDIPL